MVEVMIAGAFLLISHFGISSSPARAVLVGKLGEGPYLGLYSLVSLAALGWLIYAFSNATRFDYLWPLDASLYWVSKLSMPIAVTFMLGGFLVPNPTQVGMGDRAADPDPARGLVRITRHPFMWAVIIWSIGHIVANPDTVAVTFFSIFLLLAGLGTILIDAKKAATLGSSWTQFASVTSNVPFAAILAGRNKLVLSELWLPVLIGVVGYLAMFWGHEWLSGGAAIYW